jgi:hypothetical protein
VEKTRRIRRWDTDEGAASAAYADLLDEEEVLCWVKEEEWA